ncbi:hypothetical protein D3C86_1431790 [compost metagenome]
MRENFFLRAKAQHPAVTHHHHQIDAFDGAGAMGNDDDDAAARPDVANRIAQGSFAFTVQIGVRLIEKDEEGFAKQGTGKADALFLPARQSLAAVANIGIVTVGQVQDQLMHLRSLGCGDDCFRSRIAVEARNVLRHRPRHQFHLLGHVTDGFAEKLEIPLVECGPIKADGATFIGPDAGHQACQRGLAGRAWANDA